MVQNNLSIMNTAIGGKTISIILTSDAFGFNAELVTYIDSGDYGGSGPAICTLSQLFSSYIVDVSVMSSRTSNITSKLKHWPIYRDTTWWFITGT